MCTLNGIRRRSEMAIYVFKYGVCNVVAKSFSAALAASVVLLSACSSEETPAETPIIDDKVEAIEQVAQTPAVLEKYVGGSFLVPQGDFIGSLVLKSDKNFIEKKSPYTDTYPPMPAIIDRLRVFQLENGYRFYAPALEIDILAGIAASDTRVEIQQSQNSYRLSVNDIEISSGEGILINAGKFRLYSNGSGRNWDGTISDFKISSSDGEVYPLEKSE